MKYDSRIQRYEVFFNAATIGAHANALEVGFRQRDVKFLVDLFSNWVESSLEGSVIPVQNTQISRYISGLVEEGYARKVSRKGHPRFRLTRIGLIELVGRMVDREYVSERTHFFFVFYFLKNYRPRIEHMVKEEGRQFPPALKVELDALLDIEALVERELRLASRELEKLKVRMQDSLATRDLVSKGLKKGREVEQLVAEAEELYPYELNSQKPLTELMGGIPEEVRAWELTEGNSFRVNELWGPQLALLRTYVDQLAGIKQDIER